MQLDLLVRNGHSALLKGILHGIEKEGLRVDSKGHLSQRAHPRQLGSALTHSHITTDYSEALVEYITPVFEHSADAIEFLADLHRFGYGAIGDELVWNASMPCDIPDEESIPIARYGSSNSGTLKHLYRVGLKYRYGKMMQTIAGIHYNFSLPDKFWIALKEQQQDRKSLRDFRSEQYFRLIRNFRRYGWMLLYLFGASPALCSSFLKGRDHQLQPLDAETLYLPYATSLRMSDLGYSNKAQSSLDICFNHLQTYTRSLHRAIHTPYPSYERIGVKVDGEYRQINANILQIENEYYSDIRPKRVVQSGEKPLHALQTRGVEYVEVRNLDINPFEPVGIDSTQADFLDAFLVTCLLTSGDLIDDEECERISDNQRLVVTRGREPGLMLACGDAERSLSDWGQEILAMVARTAEVLDRNVSDSRYSRAVAAQQLKLDDPSQTPSARILAQLQDQGISFREFALTQSRAHRDQLSDTPLNDERASYLNRMAASSLDEQAEIEAADSIDFDTFLAGYLAE
ncbi:glutamate--cysteine ligase [Marinobacterium nitratireducens]|uniref:Glutamate--cysteine ligase n=2 Tax=Marinobacterium nitratireducens TaxID=518897 RepID=A0A917ZQ97_9GAMM|nr:glutamate--cysteine ligase [Marinobacterium nitratireducens]